MKKDFGAHVIALGAFVVFIVLGLACASTPRKTIEVSESYRGFTSAPVGTERIIGRVQVQGKTSFVSQESQPSVTPAQRLGAPYEVSLEEPTQKTGLAAMFATVERDRNRHDHEPIFDQLQSEAKRQFPSEVVSIRNAKTAGFNPTNARQETYSESVKGSDGKYYSVQRTRTIWDVFPVYTADIITTQPMPPPVIYSEHFTVAKSTRADIFRLARRWIRDNSSSKYIIVVNSEDINIGELMGTVTYTARADDDYQITSKFTFDIMDAGVDMKFDSTKLTNGRDIFLKSIADSAQKELVNFSTSIKSYIITGR